MNKYKTLNFHCLIANFFSMKKMKNWKKSNISGHVNYKNILLLRHYITVSGKIIPKRLNHLTTKRQRFITKAIKNARLMSFLPFVRLSFY